MSESVSFYEKLRVTANTIMIANVCILLLAFAIYMTSNAALIYIFIPYMILMMVFYYKSRHYKRDNQQHLIVVVQDTMPPMDL